jgi:putative PIN family toxin of toxin-antitoxin system
MKIVLDTNCLLPAIFKKSVHHWIWEAFRANQFTLCYTTEILHEYEELLLHCYSPAVTENVMNELLNAPNTERITVFFNWYLISADSDDNKFVDCAISAGARYIVTNDKHFNILKQILFPQIQVLDIIAFKQIIS